MKRLKSLWVFTAFFWIGSASQHDPPDSQSGTSKHEKKKKSMKRRKKGKRDLDFEVDRNLSNWYSKFPVSHKNIRLFYVMDQNLLFSDSAYM